MTPPKCLHYKETGSMPITTGTRHKLPLVFSYVHGMQTSRTAACKTSGLINEATDTSVALVDRKLIVC